MQKLALGVEENLMQSLSVFLSIFSNEYFVFSNSIKSLGWVGEENFWCDDTLHVYYVDIIYIMYICTVRNDNLRLYNIINMLSTEYSAMDCQSTL